jgi:hypothetical protein
MERPNSMGFCDPMARFYIHLENGDGFLPDEFGRECADEEAARKEAVCTGADIIADELKQGCSSVQVTLFIEDEDHLPLMQVPMSANITS